MPEYPDRDPVYRTPGPPFLETTSGPDEPDRQPRTFDCDGRQYIQASDATEDMSLVTLRQLNAVHAPSGLTEIVAGLGDLNFWYRLGEIGSPPSSFADSSDYHNNASYIEDAFTCTSETWNIANRATFGVSHDNLGADDDGAVEFNYDQTNWTPSNQCRPGAHIESNPTTTVSGRTVQLSLFKEDTAHPDDPYLRTVMCFFKPKIGTAVNIGTPIISTAFNPVGGTAFGETLLGYNSNLQNLQFGISGASTVTAHAPATGAWYHAALTWDETTYRLYLNGSEAASIVRGPIDPTNNRLQIGYAMHSLGVSAIEMFYYGSVDEVLGFSRTLTETEILSVAELGAEGVSIGPPHGPTSSRPTTGVIGSFYFDTTLGKPIWWSGSHWVDATGTSV